MARTVRDGTGKRLRYKDLIAEADNRLLKIDINDLRHPVYSRETQFDL